MVTGDDVTALTPGGKAGGAGGAAAAGTIERGAILGRYVILEELGAGGMGVVYAAYDPKLDRRVALKLLRAGSAGSGGSDGAARLQREAQAIARLSHPNVVAVHDVGTLDGQVFVAMEYVAGMTLGQWLAAQARAPREVLEVYAMAGRGLAAAHAAGLVHRDFKPDNALIGEDGRVRVMDFGLARPAEKVAGAAAVGAPAAGRLIDAALTQTGALVGTPRYMAPEQIAGGATGAATDQFSFCVALYEALYGGRPFPGDDLGTVRDAMAADVLPEPPAGVKVAAPVRRALERGLRFAPAERWPSMAALLDELAREPAAAGPPRRRWGAVIAIGALVAALVVALRPAGVRPCRGGAEQLAGAWDEAGRVAVREAFHATGKPFADAAWRTATARLDAYAAAWVSARAAACEATRVRGEQSEELLELRMGCLDRLRGELGSAAELLAQGGPEVVERAAQVAGGLSPVAGCADVAALRAPLRLPADPAVRARIDEVRAQLGRVRALRDAGRYGEGRPLAAQAAAAAGELGYPPLRAEALYLTGSIEQRGGDAKAGEATLYEAVGAAEAGHHDEIAARAWTELVLVVGDVGARYDEGLRLAAVAAGAVARAGGAPELEAPLLVERATLRFRLGRHDVAQEDLERALALWQKVRGEDSPEGADALNRLGMVLNARGEHDRALAVHRRSLAARERALGPDHPSVAGSLTSIAEVLATRGKYEEALPVFERVLALRERTLGADHRDVGSALNNLGAMYYALGRNDQALVTYERALPIMELSFGSEHPHVASLLSNIGDVLVDLGRPEDSLAPHRRALAIRTTVLGPAHTDTGISHVNLGAALAALGKDDEAVAEYRLGLAAWDQSLPPEHPLRAYALTGLADIHATRGAWAAALPLLEQALALREREEGDPDALAETRFLLARALWQTGGDRARARALAAQARTTYQGPPPHPQLPIVEAWQAGH